MDTEARFKAETIANFRFGLIANIISRTDLGPGEQAQELREIASQSYEIPYSSKTAVSVRTLERYLTAYRQGGWEALKPNYRARCRRIPSTYINQALALRRENPKRSIERIIFMLESAGTVPPGVLKESTLYDHFSKAGLTRTSSPGSRDNYRRYQAQARNKLWQGDICHLVHHADPKTGKKHKTYLVAWLDDYSRLVPHAQLYPNEKLPMLEDCLKRAIISYGVPEQIYVDNGAAYSSHHFARVLGKLGVKLSHSRPYRPAGRGKIERFFQFVQSSFVSELHSLLKKEELPLAQINELFLAWLKTYYHNRRHSATKQKPLLRFEADPTPLRTIDLAELNDVFLVEVSRKADKTGVVSLDGCNYEVCSELAKRTVLLRYDPYEPETVQVWYDDRRYPDARVLTIPEHSPAKRPEESPQPEAPATGLNFVSLIKEKHDATRGQAGMRYARHRKER